MASRGALLKSFLFRFRQTAVRQVPLRDLVRPTGKVNSEVEQKLNEIMTLPDYRLWSPVIDWLALHGKQVLSCAPWEFVDMAEFWLFMSHVLFRDSLFQLQDAPPLARLIVDLASRTAAHPGHYSRHSDVGKIRCDFIR